MNLNFYQPDNNNYLENLRNTLNDQIAKLDQLRNVSLNPSGGGQNTNNTKVNQPLQPQRYYLDCGIKEDWEEFLKLNYGITEAQIFDDYRLFLQAKLELSQDNDKEKLEAMKNKLKPKQQQKGHKVNVPNNTNANVSSANINSKQSMEQHNKEVQG